MLPQDEMGSSCSINTQSATSPENVDTYKGVVPNGNTAPPSETPVKISPSTSPDITNGGCLVTTVVLQKQFKIIHFNDVYNIEARDEDPCGGASRFVQKISDLLAVEDYLVLFSGDAFNPSPMSTMFKGVQMVPVLNACNVAAAVYGNHDFDFGVDDLLDLKNACTFPWLMSNVIDRETNGPLGDGIKSLVLDWKGVKVGLLGLVELGWMETLSTIEVDEIDFEDYLTCGDRHAKQLKEEGAEIVIALTHMRWNNDRRLTEHSQYIDMVLGGHDHNYGLEYVNDKLLLKSGTDFREFTAITVTLDSKSVSTTVERINITLDMPENENMSLHVASYVDKVAGQMEKVVGEFGVPLETRFSEIRTRETNTGNFITDVMRVAMRADIALLNSGTMRSDCVFPAGKFKMKHLCSILPIMDELILLEVTGAQLIEALENGVSKYPEHEGRFPQVSGVQFTFDPEQEPGHRIVEGSVFVLNEQLDLQTKYKVTVKEYLSRGRDGYTVLAHCPKLSDDDDGPILDVLILNHFEEVARQRKLRKENTPVLKHTKGLNRRPSIHRQHSLLSIPKSQIPKHVLPKVTREFGPQSGEIGTFARKDVPIIHPVKITQDWTAPGEVLVETKQEYLSHNLKNEDVAGAQIQTLKPIVTGRILLTDKS